VNLRNDAAPPTLISTRALEPLYNIDIVLRAFARLRESMPGARIVFLHEGSIRAELERLCASVGLGYTSDSRPGMSGSKAATVEFRGKVAPQFMHELLSRAHLYVSVPSSDSLALSTMEAMACGAFPVVTDLPSQDGWIEHRVNGLRVPVRDVDALADALKLGLSDISLRRDAVELNRSRVLAEGSLEANMSLMESHYFRLAGREMRD
jgi:glycosyltransferase involved in cell wall biosynthesis